jgi:hypothetical protein
MTSTTDCGAVAIGVWSTFSERTRAPMAGRHKALRRRIDHPVIFGNEEPGWLGLPAGSRRLFLDAGERERPLRRGKKRRPFGGCVLGESRVKCFPRHPDKAVCVGGQLPRLRVRLLAIKDFGDGLAFVGCQGGDIDQRPNLLVGGRGDHRAGVSMRRQDDGTVDVLQRAVKRRDAVR